MRVEYRGRELRKGRGKGAFICDMNTGGGSENTQNLGQSLGSKISLLFCEYCVYKLIASHPCKPKIRNKSPKFSKLAKGGPELSNQ